MSEHSPTLTGTAPPARSSPEQPPLNEFIWSSTWPGIFGPWLRTIRWTSAVSASIKPSAAGNPKSEAIEPELSPSDKWAAKFGLTGQIVFSLNRNHNFFSESIRTEPIFEDIDNDNRAEIVISTSAHTFVYEFVGGGVGVNGPEQSNIPKSSQLFQNYPNPFNPETTIEYSVIESSPVEIFIFNQLGQRVRILVDKQNVQPGKYSVTWDSKRAMN